VPALLLDLDRTLVDLQSFTDYDAAWAEVSELVDPSLGDAGPDTTWSSTTRACMGVIAGLTDPAVWRTVSATIERHERAAIVRSTPMPHLDRFLAATVARQRAVITLLPEAVARDVLAAHGVTIDVVIGRDPTIRPKPSGDGLRAALARLPLEPGAAATMVGDSTWDAAAAHDAGVGFIGVHTGHDEWAAIRPTPPVCATLLEVLDLLDALGD
jgi:phosphoglycolate phosphatase-like HAD superfamily hydrolase